MLDTLVDAGVARSRSHALAWCVRLVGDHEGEWIDQLREAIRVRHYSIRTEAVVQMTALFGFACGNWRRCAVASAGGGCMCCCRARACM